MPKKTNKAQASDAAIYGRLLSYVTPYWGAFLLSVVGFVLYSISNVGFMQLVAYIVDSLSGHDPLVHSRVAPMWLPESSNEAVTFNEKIKGPM